MRQYKESPFFLDDGSLDWVSKTYESLTPDERIGQLFCLIAYEYEESYLQGLLDLIKPGGIMLRPMSLESTVNAAAYLQQNANLPLLIAANLEKGASGVITEGTNYASPMEIGATGDAEMAARLGEICGSETSACGVNWAFAPIIDIDYNFRNPITNTRTFGSNPALVRDMGAAYVRALQSHGMAASIKHFPGDGCDERDQHLVSSINDLSCEQWDATFGENYRASIEAGAKTCMVGHILQPAYSRRLNPALKDEEILPATLSAELVNGLLKGKLGFKGLVVTDATTMAGMAAAMPRHLAVPTAIACGCDMFLFCRNAEEDLAFMRQGLRDGVITPERLKDAVCKVLALKASLRLPQKRVTGTLIPDMEKARAAIGLEKHRLWAAECADRAVTLVKEEKGVLPLSPQKTKRMLFYPIQSEQGFIYSVDVGVTGQFAKLLKDEGFEVTVYQPTPGFEGMMSAQSDILDHYDVIVYLANMATKSNQTTVRIEWAQPMGANVPVYMHQVPTVFISVENPYHLIDVPRVRTFINAYHSTPAVLKAVVDKLCGRSAFVGKSPVDAFCGMWDTRLS